MRRRKATVELFEAMRREYEFGVGTIQGVARQFGVHRRMVREAIGSAVPATKPASPRARPRLGPLIPEIDRILEEDRHAPRKQRHTAHQIYARLGRDHPELALGESTLRDYVRQRQVALGLAGRATCIPQSYAWGSEGQNDRYEAEAELGGERVALQVLAVRSMASGGAFHRAYWRATQQAFLDAHEHAFRYFGGVFARMRYDNLTSAVQRVLRGHRREETARFVAFRSHRRFQAEFCNVGEAHEKGGVEGEVGRFRRAHWVPVPRAGDLAELNEYLLACCREDEARTIGGRAESVGAAMAIERGYLLPLAAEGFDLAEISFPTVNGLGCVKVRANAYSVPLDVGTPVEAKLTPATREVWYAGKCVATHERCYGRYREILDLEHYLDALGHKPGALAGSKPLEQWRKLGRWPASYDRLWEGLMDRHGRAKGTKEMIELLQLGRAHGQEKLRAAVERAAELGCGDSAAVRYLLTAASLERARPEPLDLAGALGEFRRPLPHVRDYDRLLAGAGAP
jgi:hypothetical protein